MSKRALIYARVSTELQDREGVGLPSQLAACRELAAAHALTVLEEIRDDGYSGTTLNRPGLDRLRDLLETGAAEVVVAHSPDRLSRDAAALLWLHRDLTKHGVEFLFVKGQSEDTPEGQLLFGMQALIADYERLQILERTQRGMRHIARTGRMPHYAGPYGYRYVTKADALRDPSLTPGAYLIHEPEALWVREIYALAGAGRSLRAIAARLNEEGVVTRRGRRWQPATVRNVLSNPAYVGRAVYNRLQATRSGRFNEAQRETRVWRPREEQDWITVPVPPLVTDEQFAAAQDRLQRNRELRSGRPSTTALLTGLLKCACCGLGWNWKRIKGHGYYQCRGWDRVSYGDRCPGGTAAAEPLEARVRRWLREVLADPARLAAETRRRAAEPASPLDHLEGELEAVRGQLEALTAEEAEVLRLAARAAFSAEAVEQALGDIAARRAQLREREEHLASLQTLRRRQVGLDRSLEGLSALVRARLEEGLSLAEERELLRLICKRILIDPRSAGLVIELYVPQGEGSGTVKVTEETFTVSLTGQAA